MLLEAEATPGVEEVNHQAYRRTVLVDGRAGWLEVWPAPQGNYMVLSLSLPEYPRLHNALAQVRRMFDLDADPVRIRQQLGSDDIAGPLMRTSPGVRIPGSWDGFEVAVRTLVAKHVTESRVRIVTGILCEYTAGTRDLERGICSRPQRRWPMSRQVQYFSTGWSRTSGAWLMRQSVGRSGSTHG